MESNGVETYVYGWGMSLATQRAKERENQTPDVKVMVETVKLGTLKLGGAVVPLVRAVVPSWYSVVVPLGGAEVSLVSGFFVD